MMQNKYKFLEVRPGSLYRQPFLKGTRVRAEIPYSRTLAAEDEEGEIAGETAEEVAADLHVPIEAVREAIDYCTTHADVIEADHAREERLMDATGMNHPDYKNNPKKYYRLLEPEDRARIINDEPLSR